MRYQAYKSKQYGPIYKLAGYQGVEIILTSPDLCRQAALVMLRASNCSHAPSQR